MPFYLALSLSPSSPSFNFFIQFHSILSDVSPFFCQSSDFIDIRDLIYSPLAYFIFILFPSFLSFIVSFFLVSHFLLHSFLCLSRFDSASIQWLAECPDNWTYCSLKQVRTSILIISFQLNWNIHFLLLLLIPFQSPSTSFPFFFTTISRSHFYSPLHLPLPPSSPQILSTSLRSLLRYCYGNGRNQWRLRGNWRHSSHRSIRHGEALDCMK